MSDRFDDWIRDAAPEVPDSSEFKRLHLANIETRLVAASRRRRLPRSSLVAAAILLSLMVGTHGVLDSEDLSLRRMSAPIIEGYDPGGQFGQVANNWAPGESPADAQARLERTSDRQGELLGIDGRLLGEYSFWNKTVRFVTGDFVDVLGVMPRQPASRMDRSLLELIQTESYAAATAAIETRPPDEQGFMEVDGVRCRYRSWTFEDPKLGIFKIVSGEPVTEPQ